MVEDNEKITSLVDDLADTDGKRIVLTKELTKRKKEMHDWGSSHAFSLLHLHHDEKMPYYAIRCKRHKMTTAINKLRRKHPHAVVVFQHRRVANGVNLFNRLREKKLIKSKFNYCRLKTSENDLIEAITEICGRDYPPEVLMPMNAWAAPINAVTTSKPPEPAKFPVHIISYTPPASPTPTAPIASSTPAWMTQEPLGYSCSMCNRVEPSIMHLFIHQANCEMKDRYIEIDDHYY